MDAPEYRIFMSDRVMSMIFISERIMTSVDTLFRFVKQIDASGFASSDYLILVYAHLSVGGVGLVLLFLGAMHGMVKNLTDNAV